MENNTIIKCTNVIDDSICTVFILKYKVYRNDSGKLFGRLLVLKHKVENFLKEVLDEEILFQNPVLQRTKDGLLDLFQGLTSLCSGISPSGETLTIPELPNDSGINKLYEMKFIKGPSPSEMWLCYVNNGEFLNLLKRLSEKYDNDELESFIFYPRIGEHVYFKQGPNIFRGIVQEYVIPDDCEDEERVDIKVLNIDNSDVIVLPQNCFFQLDKDGIELPMQCVLCSLEEADKSSAPEKSVPAADLSLNMLKKHKLNVSFCQKKLNLKGSPLGAQCVSIVLSPDKVKDKKNGFNVNSKEFVPRNSISNEVQPATSISDSDNKSDETTRSSSPGSSQDDAAEKPLQNTAAAAAASSSSISAEDKAKNTHSVENEKYTISFKDTKSIAAVEKEKVENKTNVIHYPNKNNDTAVNNTNAANTFRPHDNKDRNVYNKDYRYNTSKVIDNKGNKSLPAITGKMKNTSISSPSNENRTKSGPPSTSSHPSQTQSPASLLPNAQVPPYLFQSVPQFPPAPIHFSGQYVPIPAPQQLNSSMPFHFPQYPYAPAYLPSAPPPPANHSQAYHMPPASAPYQPYMQPVAVGPFFSSQPPFSQQFYQPSHLQPTWSHLQPSFNVGGGSPQQPAGGAGKIDVPNASSISKYK